MSDVARRAEVAIGTVYRHFPSKEALVDALLSDQLDIAAQATHEAVADKTDPWEALEAFLATITRLQVQNRSFSDYIGGRIPGSAELRASVNELFANFTGLVDAAHDSGQLRADVEATDIRMAMICVARAIRVDWPDPDWLLQRYLRIVLDGLRAPGHPALGSTTPATRDFLATGEQRGPAAFQRGRRRWRP